MIKKNNGEIWKQLQFKGWKQLRKKYAVSSHGRVASYKEDIVADGKLLEGSLTSGYKTLNLHINGTNGTIYFHREVAKLFNKKNSPKEKFVIHLNHSKTDNNYKNLKWSTQKDVSVHQQKSPDKIAYKKVQNSRTRGLKLDAKQVKTIKTLIENPRRKLTYKQIAGKYNVSEMTIYRIKSGENWSNI
ncbi:MAG TPA: HNH endonuclease [Chitinophagaceae bacterium]|nr:HNH endonuclease [Chitinophagaceae bacterium]